MSVRGATFDRVRVAGLGAALAVLMGFAGGIVAAILLKKSSIAL
jgi:hypothetical protein